MVFDKVWSIWPFRGYFGSKGTRRVTKQNSRCSQSQRRADSMNLIHFLGPWESNMVALQSILIWEKPGKSIVAVALANLFYWYLACSEIRFFFGISVLGLAAFLHHEWVNTIWPEISVPKSPTDQEEWTPVHPSVLSAPEVSRYLKNTWKYILEQQIWLAQLRRRHPGWFCLGMSVCLSFLVVLGHLVSGMVLLYCILMGVMCGPGLVIRCVPKSTFARIRKISSALFGKKDGNLESPESDLAEFLPEESNPDVQTALSIPLTSSGQGNLDSNLDSDTGGQKPRGKTNRARKGKGNKGKGRETSSTEVGSSFTAGLSENDFPSLEESAECPEESDLALPEILPDAGNAEEVDEVDAGVDDVDVDDVEGEIRRVSSHEEEIIHFVSTHFSDSTDEEDDFADGLSFRRANMTPRGEEGDFGGLQFPSVVTQFAQTVAAEHTANIFTSIGQQILTAVSGASSSSQISPVEEEDTPGTPAAPLATDPSAPVIMDTSGAVGTSESGVVGTSESGNMGSSESSYIEEDFELISDDDLQ